MKEININGEIYIRKKDISAFLTNEIDNVLIDTPEYLTVKEIISGFIVDKDKYCIKKNNTYMIDSDTFRDGIKKLNLRESAVLKKAFGYGLIIKASQQRFRHCTSHNGIKKLYIKIDMSKFT
jgi:hypothetical protein